MYLLTYARKHCSRSLLATERPTIVPDAFIMKDDSEYSCSASEKLGLSLCQPFHLYVSLIEANWHFDYLSPRTFTSSFLANSRILLFTESLQISARWINSWYWRQLRSSAPICQQISKASSLPVSFLTFELVKRRSDNKTQLLFWLHGEEGWHWSNVWLLHNREQPQSLGHLLQSTWKLCDPVASSSWLLLTA